MLYIIWIMKKQVFPLVLAITFLIVTGCGSGGGSGGGIYGSAVEDIQTSLQKVSVSNSTTDSVKPVISANSKGTLYIAWEEATSGSGKEIYLVSSVDYGKTFFPMKGISKIYCKIKDGLPVSGDIRLIAGEDGALHLAWIDRFSDVSKVMFYNDFTSCNSVSGTDLKVVHSPYINLNNNGEISIAWAGTDDSKKEIYYSKLDNVERKFSAPLNISKTPESDSSEPLLAVEGSFNVKAVWVEGDAGSTSVASSKLVNWPDHFLQLKNISSASNVSYCPVATSTSSGTYIAYKGDNKIHFSLWNPIFLSFADPSVISPGSYSPSCPQIASDLNGVIYVAWSDMNSIWLSISVDGGVTFDGPNNISSIAGINSSPGITVFGSFVSVVWEGNNGGNKDIFLSVSKDNGKSFSTPMNLSNSPASSSSPVIANDSKKYIYVAWEEGAEGGRDIYFLKYAP